VDMGNPHVVTFVDDLDSAPVTSAGPEIETHTTFPDKTNVEFVRIDGHDRISVRTWERGVGETHACGTGAGAAVVAAHKSGLVGTEVNVGLLGGDLSIRLEGDDVWQEGPAEYVFRGSTTLLEGDRQPDLLEA
ncbi:MAG: diaminopimelate epimerase, partial [Acidimicrobiia bacterium]|nr:diaminopimelate epimerase [Acidimicrobiia bacterium]